MLYFFLSRWLHARPWHLSVKRDAQDTKEEVKMVTSPIRTKEEIEKMKDYYLTKSHFRDYALFVIGINTALRISDLLRLRWRDVYDAQTRRYKNHIDI